MLLYFALPTILLIPLGLLLSGLTNAFVPLQTSEDVIGYIYTALSDQASKTMAFQIAIIITVCVFAIILTITLIKRRSKSYSSIAGATASRTSKTHPQYKVPTVSASPVKGSVICPHCGFDNVHGAKLCVKCGKTLYEG